MTNAMEMRMPSVLSSIFGSRIFYNWRMARRGGGYMVASLVAAGGAGAFAAAARHSTRMASLGVTPALGLAGFIVLVLAAGLLWWRFSSLQDEMFKRIQNYSYGWGAAVSIAVLVVWGIANGARLAPPIGPLAPLVVFAVTHAFFWMVATRKWL
ncbi:MAG TPA: hypothetical protein VFW35_09995 [Sphingomicrobium sp.]|nr:hypothetical protein [Sphingomicrobium sp.]